MDFFARSCNADYEYEVCPEFQDPVIIEFYETESKLFDEEAKRLDEMHNDALAKAGSQRKKKTKKRKNARKQNKSNDGKKCAPNAEKSPEKAKNDKQNETHIVDIPLKSEVTENESISKPTVLPDPAKSAEEEQPKFDNAKDLIDRLANTDDSAEQVENLAEKFLRVKQELEEMPFGPERQNKAADLMMEAMKSLNLTESASGSDGSSDA